MLYEMFTEEKERVQKLHSDGLSLSDIINIIVPDVDAGEDDLEQLLKKHSESITDNEDEIYLKLKRSLLWNKAKVFYKNAMLNVDMLKKPLVIEFEDEDGIDGGALRNEFFVSLLKTIDTEYFEGLPFRRLPKSHWGHETEQVLAGAAIAHSVLLGGPGFPCLHPGLYDMLTETVTEGVSVSVEEIPVNAATANLLEMIKLVSL